MRENLDDELTEVKSENAIDRITSQANPRTLERVPAGARFRVRFVMDVLCEEDAPLFLRVLEGAAAARRRRARRRRFARQRAGALRQSAAGLARRGTTTPRGAPEKEFGAGADLAALQAAVQTIPATLSCTKSQ